MGWSEMQMFVVGRYNYQVDKRNMCVGFKKRFNMWCCWWRGGGEVMKNKKSWNVSLCVCVEREKEVAQMLCVINCG